MLTNLFVSKHDSNVCFRRGVSGRTLCIVGSFGKRVCSNPNLHYKAGTCFNVECFAHECTIATTCCALPATSVELKHGAAILFSGGQLREFTDEESNFAALLQRAMDLEGVDRETVHHLVALLMKVCSSLDQINISSLLTRLGMYLMRQFACLVWWGFIASFVLVILFALQFMVQCDQERVNENRDMSGEQVSLQPSFVTWWKTEKKRAACFSISVATECSNLFRLLL